MLVAQHTVYFPDAFLTQMREAMPSTLSFDDFLAACQRPLRRSIRVNTLKTSVADFLQLTAPYGWTLTPHGSKEYDLNGLMMMSLFSMS